MTLVRIKVLFFGVLKDVTGLREDALEVAGGLTLRGVFDHYADRFPALKEMAGSIMLARNQEFGAAADAVENGDEIAFLPPVSGGSAHEIATPEGHYFAITRGVIDAQAVKHRIQQGIDGAVVDFEGVVRNNTKGRATRYLDYECYEAMALKMMTQIGVEIAKAHSVSRIAIVHRLGKMAIGETSVAVVVASPHRGPAFAAALDGINRLKKLVPIWKKEYFADGEVWVEGEWDETLSKPGV